MGKEINIRFSGTLPDGLQFVEIEDSAGESIDIGEWDSDDGDYVLSIEVPEDCI